MACLRCSSHKRVKKRESWQEVSMQTAPLRSSALTSVLKTYKAVNVLLKAELSGWDMKGNRDCIIWTLRTCRMYLFLVRLKCFTIRQNFCEKIHNLLG